jgi:hypothetical protein
MPKSDILYRNRRGYREYRNPVSFIATNRLDYKVWQNSISVKAKNRRGYKYSENHHPLQPETVTNRRGYKVMAKSGLLYSHKPPRLQGVAKSDIRYSQESPWL